MTQYPKGYVGTDHTTRGGDILAVLQTVNLPEMTLGAELAARLRAVKPEEWYPIGDFLEMLERLDQKLGSFHLKQVGWTIVQKFIAPDLRTQGPSARDVLRDFDRMYHVGNKGTDIGGWTLVSFETGRAELEKNTPHHCVMEEGIVEELMRTVGVAAKVHQSRCFRKGAETCRYVVETTTTDERWTGKAPA